MNSERFADMSSRGPQFPDEIKANWILAKRYMRAEGYSFDRMETRLSDELQPYVNKNGLPVERTIQGWEKSKPDLPEKVLRDKMVKQKAILDWLRPYCQWEGFQASQHQEITLNSSGGSGLGLGRKLASAAVGYVIYQASQKRPARRTMRITGRRRPI